MTTKRLAVVLSHAVLLFPNLNIMQTQLSDARQSRRYNAKNLGYQATVVIGKELHDYPVLDFSANGLQIEIPVSVVMQTEGALQFREQTYRYTVRNEVADEHSKRLGLEIRIVRQDVQSTNTRVAHYQPEHFTGQGYLHRKNWKFVIGAVTLLGGFITLAMFCGPSLVHDGRDSDTFWQRLARTVRPLSMAGSTVTDGNDSGGPKSSKRSAEVREAVSRAHTFFNQSNYDAVVEACTLAISINGRDAEAWQLRGNAYRSLARHDLAINDLNRAVSLNAKALPIQADLAEAYCDAGRFNEGIKQVERGFKLAVGDLRLRFKQIAARAYTGRSANRMKDGDQEGAEADRARAEQWNGV